MFTVTLGLEVSGNNSTCSPFGYAYSVMPSTDVTFCTPDGKVWQYVAAPSRRAAAMIVNRGICRISASFLFAVKPSVGRRKRLPHLPAVVGQVSTCQRPLAGELSVDFNRLPGRIIASAGGCARFTPRCRQWRYRLRWRLRSSPRGRAAGDGRLRRRERGRPIRASPESWHGPPSARRTGDARGGADRKSTRLNSSHRCISYD